MEGNKKRRATVKSKNCSAYFMKKGKKRGCDGKMNKNGDNYGD
jgi:hypothetical protein